MEIKQILLRHHEIPVCFYVPQLLLTTICEIGFINPLINTEDYIN